MQFRYQLVDKSRQKTLPPGVPSFGALRTNHMFVVNYEKGAWDDPRIVPYEPFASMPGAVCLHYGQTIFEGAKGFRHADGELYLFRVDKNFARMNHSANIICLPEIPVELQREGLLRLADLERDWCPTEPESSLYIRPFMFGCSDTIGVKPSDSCVFCIILSPSGPYYRGGFSEPLRLLVSTQFHRAVSGGTGSSKCGGNYAASLRAAAYAESKGASQVLYLDAGNRYIEEVGTMNHYHVLKDGTFVIPEFNDSILRSITSESVLELATMGRIKARSERIEVKDFIAKLKAGEIIEAGGFGTAAVVSPVGSYLLESGEVITVGNGQIGEHSRALYKMYTDMQNGWAPAPEGWLTKVPQYQPA
ncbi:MAG: branched-chain amino acid aminotransferase [Deltaproteobacteria bacterium]|jgi:branched-chain amino acid aminotransferase|nr:branched-chain amino acid aminotransferase [Deltaproteobacteria bacterium]